MMGLDAKIVKSTLGRYKISCPRDGRLKKGHKAWNKGQHVITNPKCLKTTFKKGNIPANSKWDGYISIRRDKTEIVYLYIRIASGKWKPLHRYLYEQRKGPIPPGMILIFKDGNTFNINMNNLELISRKEHARRNHNCKKAAKSLKETYRREKIRKRYGLTPITKHYQRIVNY
jgi:hypothetical protein